MNVVKIVQDVRNLEIHLGFHLEGCGKKIPGLGTTLNDYRKHIRNEHGATKL